MSEVVKSPPFESAESLMTFASLVPKSRYENHIDHVVGGP